MGTSSGIRPGTGFRNSLGFFFQRLVLGFFQELLPDSSFFSIRTVVNQAIPTDFFRNGLFRISVPFHFLQKL